MEGAESTSAAITGGDLITPERVRETISGALRPLPPARVALADAFGLVLAEPIIAPCDLPRFANAAMDGFAVRSVDVAGSTTLRLAGQSLAGHPFRGSLSPGQAVSIATGAMLPDRADAVVPVEDATVAGSDVVIRSPVRAGADVRGAGEDLRAGDTLVEAGAVLGPGQLAAASALGLAEVVVQPRPRVAVLPTGDEVVPAGEPLGPGQVHDAASIALSMLIQEVGAVAVPQPIAPDDLAALIDAIAAAAAGADAIVTVGGVSMGERDCLRSLAEPAGRESAGEREGRRPSRARPGAGPQLQAFQVALRPARPFIFGLVHGVPLFGLPGNPASALAAFEELVRPGLMAMMGRTPSVRPAVRATLAEPLSQKPGRLHLVRAEAWRDSTGKLWAKPAGRQGAGMIHSLARAQAWAIVPAEVSELPAGSPVDLRLLVEVP